MGGLDHLWIDRDVNIGGIEARVSAGEVSKNAVLRSRARLIVVQLHLPARILLNSLIRAERRRRRRAAKLLRCG